MSGRQRENDSWVRVGATGKTCDPRFQGSRAGNPLLKATYIRYLFAFVWILPGWCRVVNRVSSTLKMRHLDDSWQDLHSFCHGKNVGEDARHSISCTFASAPIEAITFSRIELKHCDGTIGGVGVCRAGLVDCARCSIGRAPNLDQPTIRGILNFNFPRLRSQKFSASPKPDCRVPQSGKN